VAWRQAAYLVSTRHRSAIVDLSCTSGRRGHGRRAGRPRKLWRGTSAWEPDVTGSAGRVERVEGDLPADAVFAGVGRARLAGIDVGVVTEDAEHAIEVAEVALGGGVGVVRRWFGSVLRDEREQHAHGGRRGHW
jgi:hypothetical protein